MHEMIIDSTINIHRSNDSQLLGPSISNDIVQLLDGKMIDSNNVQTTCNVNSIAPPIQNSSEKTLHVHSSLNDTNVISPMTNHIQTTLTPTS